MLGVNDKFQVYASWEKSEICLQGSKMVVVDIHIVLGASSLGVCVFVLGIVGLLIFLKFLSLLFSREPS